MSWSIRCSSHGHINHFKKAKDYGSVTIVTVTSDRFVNKGINRPIFSQEKRIAFIAELDCVDYVFYHQMQLI